MRCASLRDALRAWVLSAAIIGVPGRTFAGEPAAGEKPAVRPEGTGVPVRSVVLYSSGVGFFEHFGTVKGSSSAELRFKTRQINDILKSLILQDLDGGKVTAISYPSQDPIDKTLRSFQVDITKNPSLGELLNQLRGAKVKVYLGAETATGTVLGVEKKTRTNADKEQIEMSVLNLFTGMGVKAVNLDALTNIDFEDAQLRAELGKALGALSESRDQDKKPVTINFSGDRERRVRLAYLVETPVWKTSYRLILSEAKEARSQADLQGWAIVENQTDNDWNDVQLSLVSGRPISFIQDLYQPLYIPRPVLRPKLYASLRPQTYEAGLTEEQEKQRQEQDQKAQEQMQQQQAQFRGHGSGGGAQGGGGGMFGNAGGARGDEQPFDPTASVSSLASANKLGELFQYTVGNVTLPRQRSAMIPIVTDPMEVEKLSIYDSNVMERYPLYGARIKNTTKKHLLAGPITVIEGATYAGDASIEDIPPGQERFISYGVDLDVLVDAVSQPTKTSLQSAKIVAGVLHDHSQGVIRWDYTAQNKGEKDKALIVEYVRTGEWELIDTPKPVEKTIDRYRFKVALAAGKTTKLAVTEQGSMDNPVQLMQATLETVDGYAAHEGVPKVVQDALKAVNLRKRELAQMEARLQAAGKQVSEITLEQTRIRENMKTVNQQQSEYYSRLLKKLNDQETEIEKLRAEESDLRSKLDTQRKDLETFVRELHAG